MSSPRELILPKSGLLLWDDFLSNDLVTDNNIGQLGWQFTTIGATASVFTYPTSQQSGVLRATTGAVADGNGSVIHLLPNALILQTDVQFGARIQYPVELASGNFRFGLQDSVTATRPAVGITLESDAGVLSCNTDSATEGDESALVTGHADLTSGTTMVVAEWIDIEARCHGTNKDGGPANVDFFVNGLKVATVPCNIDNDEPVEWSLAHWQDSGGADAVALEIDYAWLWIPRS